MEMNNENILKIAMQQSALDANCAAGDFMREENVIVPSVANPGARKYLTLPFDCSLISYGNNIVASADEKYHGIVSGYISRFPAWHCFETPNLHVLDDAVKEEGLRVCFMAEYYLPDTKSLKELTCPYELRVLHPCDFEELYTDKWENALCKKRKELDVLGVGAYDGTKLVGLSGCSADCETMWQIGIDVLPEYRRRYIAAALTSRLALETLERGKVPFYCTAWSNIRSARNALRSGFRPAWVELNVRSSAFVGEMNGGVR